MRFVTLLLILLLASACNVSTYHVSGDAAKKAINSFHRQLDDEQYEQICNGASAELRKSSCTDFVSRLQANRRKLGKIKSTSQQGGGSTSFSASRSTMTLIYSTGFEFGKATEKFVFRFEGDSPILLSYDLAEIQ